MASKEDRLKSYLAAGFVAVFVAAIAPNPGYAKIEARVDEGTWRWSFRIPDHVELEIPDDCGPQE